MDMNSLNDEQNELVLSLVPPPICFELFRQTHLTSWLGVRDPLELLERQITFFEREAYTLEHDRLQLAFSARSRRRVTRARLSLNDYCIRFSSQHTTCAPCSVSRVLDELNRSHPDEFGPVGGEQGTTLLSEINSLIADHEEFVKSLTPRENVLR